MAAYLAFLVFRLTIGVTLIAGVLITAFQGMVMG